MHCVMYVVADSSEDAEHKIAQLIEEAPDYSFDSAIKTSDSTRYDVEYRQSVEDATRTFRVRKDDVLVGDLLYDTFEDAEVSGEQTVYAFDVHF